MAKRRSHLDEPTEKSAETDLIIRANVNRQVVMAPTFVSLYANDVQIQTSPWDVRLIFGEIFQAPSPENPNAIVRQLGELRVSPQLAKKLAEIILGQLAIYEKRFGAVPSPPDT
jgi:hypothetical protein